jgi:steroid 5-alpha reductase family enzyme
MLNPYLDSALVIWLYVTLWFLIAIIKKDNSIVDIAWGLGFVVVAWWQYFYHPHPYSSILTAVVTLWGVRLGTYLFFRNWSEGEDWRYKQMRENWKGNLAINSYFRVFILQGTVLFVISLVLMQQPDENTFLPSFIFYLGIGIFAIGFLWETIADFQLKQFKAKSENKGKFMQSGLWKYSRHPNYFGEMLVWWGIYLFTTTYGTWYLFFISPLTITFFLLRVSGIPFLKKKQSKSPKYAKYIEAVPNAILPKFW